MRPTPIAASRTDGAALAKTVRARLVAAQEARRDAWPFAAPLRRLFAIALAAVAGLGLCMALTRPPVPHQAAEKGHLSRSR
jgi:hypothetical protein